MRLKTNGRSSPRATSAKNRPKMKRGEAGTACSYFLLQGLQGVADANHDGTVTTGELFAYLNAQVRKVTENAQHPITIPGSTENIPLTGPLARSQREFFAPPRPGNGNSGAEGKWSTFQPTSQVAEGTTLATYLASALYDLCGKPIPAPLKCHSAGRGTSVPTENTDAWRPFGSGGCHASEQPARLRLHAMI
jgi:hypothetical protein